MIQVVSKINIYTFMLVCLSSSRIGLEIDETILLGQNRDKKVNIHE